MPTPFQQIILDFDALLTGREPASIERETERFCPYSARNWLLKKKSDHYYLSDAGFSRFSYYEGKLYLTSNSSDKVKRKWETPEAEKQRRHIEEMLREAEEDEKKANDPTIYEMRQQWRTGWVAIIVSAVVVVGFVVWLWFRMQ